jgi:biopolymer transport protein ExbD
MTTEEKSHRVKHEMREGKTNAQARKTKKYNEKSDETSHVDLAPMVDIALLLLMFFMVTTSFNKPNVFVTGLPEKQKGPGTPVNPDYVLTIQIARSGNVYYTRGLEGPNNLPQAVKYEEIQKTVSSISQAVKNDPKNTKKSDVITVVKIDSLSRFEDMIKTLDEVYRGGVQKWATVQLKTDESTKLNDLDKNAGGASTSTGGKK